MLDLRCDASADGDIVRSRHARGGSITCGVPRRILRALPHNKAVVGRAGVAAAKATTLESVVANQGLEPRTHGL